MALNEGTYICSPLLWSIQQPCGHVITIWALGNQPAITLSAAFLSHVITICDFTVGFWKAINNGEAGRLQMAHNREALRPNGICLRMATRTMETTVVTRHGHVTPCHLATELLVPITIIK